MAKRDFHRSLIESDEFAQYSLRATFFVRKLRSLQLWEAIDEVNRLLKMPSGFTWEKRKSWGIENDAWEFAIQKRIDPLLIFCHPRVLLEQPRLLLYYRTACLLSQKGLSAMIGGSISAVESGLRTKLDPKWVADLVIALNSVASVLIKTSANIESNDIPGFQFAAAGATIQGSWNNAIGVEGEIAVRTILVKYLKGEIAGLVWRDGRSSEFAERELPAIIDRIDELRVVRLKQGYHLNFGSEPDISFRDRNDLPIVAVEIKAGSDPAAALERLGAAMKSFDNDRNENPRLKTVYVVRCITPELQKRINQSNPFDYTFALSELLLNESRQKSFANLFLRVMLGKSRG